MLFGKLGATAALVVLFAIHSSGERVLTKVFVKSIRFGVSKHSASDGVVAHNDGTPDVSAVDITSSVGDIADTKHTQDTLKPGKRNDKTGHDNIPVGKGNKHNAPKGNKTPMEGTGAFNPNTESKRKTDPTSKIVGGFYTAENAWPWVVSVQYLNSYGSWTHFCGGSLINRHWVITAAHCVEKLQDKVVRVVLGDYQLSFFSTREQVINPSKILMHGYYNGSYWDIAMIKLQYDAHMTPQVQRITMATEQTDAHGPGDMCYIAGWGNTVETTQTLYTSDYLQQSRMTVLTNAECVEFFSTDIIDTQICIESVKASACLGDSGGPLVCLHGSRWFLVGLASYIISATCQPSSPNVFTRMSSYVEWAESVMNMH